jgi:hypothetical protein
MAKPNYSDKQCFKQYTDKQSHQENTCYLEKEAITS